MHFFIAWWYSTQTMTPVVTIARESKIGIILRCDWANIGEHQFSALMQNDWPSSYWAEWSTLDICRGGQSLTKGVENGQYGNHHNCIWEGSKATYLMGSCCRKGGALEKPRCQLSIEKQANGVPPMEDGFYFLSKSIVSILQISWNTYTKLHKRYSG